MEKIPVEKNKEYIVNIIDNGYEGEGIAKINNFIIFIKGAIKGEKCRIVIVKVTSSHAFGKLIEMIEASPNRTKADCNTYHRCGGCSLRHITYQETLKIKQENVQALVNKTLGQKMEVKKTIGMKSPYYYRNKAQYPFGYNKEGKPIVGIYAERTHEIIPMQDCKIQNPVTEEIANTVLKLVEKYNITVYNEKTNKGILRHLVIKVGVYTKQIMCIFVINENTLPREKEIVETLTKQYPEIKSIIRNSNMKNTNVILGEKSVVLFGKEYIEDTLGDYTFRISPLSFYQTNPIQTEILYKKAIEFANLKKDDILLDLYCGIGTIGIFASAHVKEVYGVEIVKEAILSAKENAKINSITNIDFRVGDVEKVLDEMLQIDKIKPNVIMLDPPRRGLDETTIRNILKVTPERVVYISCNPATMVRDLKQLEEQYEIKEVQPVDMFPFTSHVECVAVLQLK